MAVTGGFLGGKRGGRLQPAGTFGGTIAEEEELANIHNNTNMNADIILI